MAEHVQHALNAHPFMMCRVPQIFLRLAIVLLLVSGCASHHPDLMQDVQQAVQSGDYQQAEHLLREKKELQKPRNEVLYYLEQGLVAHLRGAYQESNRLLSIAKEQMDALAVFSVTETASEWLLSGKTQPYYGDDFERVLVHYYMTLNYLMLGDMQEALVECRQVDILLQMLNERYYGEQVYKTDAFLLYLSGLLYDALGATNDAFIDYRNAYNAYVSDYQSYYATSFPSQLPDHLLRTTEALGFHEEFRHYRQIFPIQEWTDQATYRDSARVVVIWHSGLIPYKVERVFREYLELDDDDDHDEGCYIKFAFPELVYRPSMFVQGTVQIHGKSYPLELAENLGRIARKNLEDQRVRTMIQATTRNVWKCVAEEELEEENFFLGLLFGIFTELSEGADTRSWLLLPTSIHIAEALLPPGKTDVTLSLQGAIGQPPMQYTYEDVLLEAGDTTFFIHRTF